VRGWGDRAPMRTSQPRCSASVRECLATVWPRALVSCDVEGSQDDRSLRASDDDRERVADVLRQAAADGRLTLAELQDRLEALYAAKTYGELEPVVSDLPRAGLPRPSSAASPPAVTESARVPDRVGGTPVSRAAKAVFGGATRRGQRVVPTRLQCQGRVRRRGTRSARVFPRVARDQDRHPVMEELFALFVGEVDLFEHLLDAVLDREQLPGVGLLGQVEGAACAGEAVRTFGEEVVGAVALAQVVVLPRLPVGGGTVEDGLGR
jgi:Domain of unknown function (DUF1707)